MNELIESEKYWHMSYESISVYIIYWIRAVWGMKALNVKRIERHY